MQIKNLHGEVIKEIEGDTLVGADLRDAYLSYADLSHADLRGAKWDDEKILAVYSFAGFGSARRMTTALITDKNTRIWCGCFCGSLAEFEARVNEEYVKGQDRYWVEYSGVVRLIKELEEEVRR